MKKIIDDKKLELVSATLHFADKFAGNIICSLADNKDINHQIAYDPSIPKSLDLLQILESNNFQEIWEQIVTTEDQIRQTNLSKLKGLSSAFKIYPDDIERAYDNAYQIAKLVSDLKENDLLAALLLGYQDIEDQKKEDPDVEPEVHLKNIRELCAQKQEISFYYGNESGVVTEEDIKNAAMEVGFTFRKIDRLYTALRYTAEASKTIEIRSPEKMDFLKFNNDKFFLSNFEVLTEHYETAQKLANKKDPVFTDSPENKALQHVYHKLRHARYMQEFKNVLNLYKKKVDVIEFAIDAPKEAAAYFKEKKIKVKQRWQKNEELYSTYVDDLKTLKPTLSKIKDAISFIERHKHLALNNSVSGGNLSDFDFPVLLETPVAQETIKRVIENYSDFVKLLKQMQQHNDNPIQNNENIRKFVEATERYKGAPHNRPKRIIRLKEIDLIDFFKDLRRQAKFIELCKRTTLKTALEDLKAQSDEAHLITEYGHKRLIGAPLIRIMSKYRKIAKRKLAAKPIELPAPKTQLDTIKFELVKAMIQTGKLPPANLKKTKRLQELWNQMITEEPELASFEGANPISIESILDECRNIIVSHNLIPSSNTAAELTKLGINIAGHSVNEIQTALKYYGLTQGNGKYLPENLREKDKLISLQIVTRLIRRNKSEQLEPISG